MIKVSLSYKSFVWLNHPIYTHFIHVFSANFKLPVEGDPFDTVEYVELGREDAEKLVEDYNKDAVSKGYRPNPQRGGRGGGGGGGGNRGMRGSGGGRRGDSKFNKNLLNI